MGQIIKVLFGCYLNAFISEYIAKVFLYSSQNWSCQYTGKSSLTYNEALSSEKEALKELENVPDCFKVPLLRCIQSGVYNMPDK